jgi:hypothetical protein
LEISDIALPHSEQASRIRIQPNILHAIGEEKEQAAFSKHFDANPYVAMQQMLAGRLGSETLGPIAPPPWAAGRRDADVEEHARRNDPGATTQKWATSPCMRKSP